MPNVEQFAYWGAGGVRGQYTRNANAWQKIRLSVDELGAVVLIPKGGRSTVPEEFAGYGKIVELKVPGFLRGLSRGKFRVLVDFCVAAKWCRVHGCGLLLSVSNEMAFLGAIVAAGWTSVWLFCWDPPGVSLWNRKDLLSRVRCRLMVWLMTCAVRRSNGLILNLHGGFADRFLKEVRSKVHVYRNGTDVRHNRACAEGVAHVPWRIAINGAFADGKGCREHVALFKRIWRQNNRASLVWVGQGDCERVRAQLIADGIPSTSFTLGMFPLDESLRLLASASVAVCLYPDLPSWRWNFILKAPEFLSMGIPIVAYGLPGLSAYVKEGVSGFLLPPSDFEGACKAVAGLLNDASRLESMRKMIVQESDELDWQAVNQRIANLLRGDV